MGVKCEVDHERGQIKFEGQREDTQQAYSFATAQLSNFKLTQLESINRDKQNLLNKKENEILKERDSHRKMEEDMFARLVRLVLSIYVLFLVILLTKTRQ